MKGAGDGRGGRNFLICVREVGGGGLGVGAIGGGREVELALGLLVGWVQRARDERGGGSRDQGRCVVGGGRGGVGCEEGSGGLVPGGIVSTGTGILERGSNYHQSKGLVHSSHCHWRSYLLSTLMSVN